MTKIGLVLAVAILENAVAVPQSTRDSALLTPSLKAACTSCAAMVDDAKTKQHDVCPGENMTECDLHMFQQIFIDELQQNCTRMLADVPDADEACATCDNRMKCATVENAQRVMDTETATLCTVMTGLECDHVDRVLRAAELRIKLSQPRLTARDEVWLIKNCGK